MKQLAGQMQFTAKHVPSIKAKGLTPAQGLLQAIWTDERFSASCVTLRNTEQIRENADAARRFEPLKQAEIEELRDAVLASNPTMCPGCDGRCSLAGGTKARLGDLRGSIPTTNRMECAALPASRTPSWPLKNATGRVPISSPPARHAITRSTSRHSCPRSIVC